MKIQANDSRLRYSGRIDWSNPEAPVFVFPCTSVQARFTGNQLTVSVKNKNIYWDNYLGCILDGEQTSILLPKNGEAKILLEVKEKEKAEHDLLLFKRQDSCHELTFQGFELPDGEQLLEPAPAEKRKIEVYGDSVSAGEVSEAVDYTGKPDPEHNGEYSNSWYSYAWMTARKLHAQIHDIAQGGIALLDHTGWFCEPHAIGMESVWNKVHYQPAAGKPTEWNFSDYTPDAVIVAFGQNDSHPTDYMKEYPNSDASRHWKKSYQHFLEKLRKTYPQAHIVCITTLLGHDPSWDQAICEAVEAQNDDKITKYTFKRNGTGTPGHLRIPEAEEMAEELAAYIESLSIEEWT